ncbi:MAG: translation elongation factor 4 [Cyanobacteriota bacterium]
MRTENIRNFCIIAHIDHGKSTLADRLLQITGTVAEREMTNQILDTMDLERERGITIKLQAARLEFKASDGNDYILNLIDTPGHVDFHYEVSRSLAACEGAILVVDSTQGVEAQTLANVYMAIEHDLEIIPVINKIDLPSADPERVKHEIEDIIGIDTSEAILTSAKTGDGCIDVLEAIVKKIPPPENKLDKNFRALIFDSVYDSYMGTMVYFKVIDGSITKTDTALFMANNKKYEITELGFMKPIRTPTDKISCGEVGYMAASIKDVFYSVGDTLTNAEYPAKEPLPGYKKAQPMVFCGLYPVDNDDYHDLKDALEKLALNDSSFTFEPETSQALGFGYRCGFLGLLHMEIIQERLEREYDLDLVITAPSVVYKVYTTDGKMNLMDNPSHLPDPVKLEKIEEPYVNVNIITPNEYVGSIMELSQSKRGLYLSMSYLDKILVELKYEIPLAELITDYYDQLKSRTRGYASMDYELSDYKESKLIKLDILVQGELVDALSTIVHKDNSFHIGQKLASKLKEVIPRQMYEVPIQASINGKIIARTNIKALRKNVTDKCYGGDITRKRKLLEKQKAGKKRMKAVGKVEIPQEAFMAVLKVE